MVRQPQINAQNRPPLTIERIIESALHIIDGQGLGRLTMRRLGDSLEVEAMAIYHHLPRGKEQLLDGLVAHVAAAPADATGAAGWRDALRRWAVAYRARLLEHAGV
ncbi:TetR/AcrR family transcriptional regulator, partial [Actinomadura kijaniata]|uniref:TetR/AcrR family transcriptional regulator n=1 Tax=Actinomadura kijaniata TaxID=46161 RepID=UPI003F1A07C1